MPGDTQKSFIRGDVAPRSTPLPFYIPFWAENAVLPIPSFDIKDPFHIPSLELSIPLNCCNCTVFNPLSPNGVQHQFSPNHIH